MARHPLDSDTVRIRWLRPGTCDDGRPAGWRTMLDAEELARADRFRFAVDRDTFIAAHALTRAMLGEATGVPADALRYVPGPFGKPALAPGNGVEGLHFNISHTRGLVACALARTEVGIDVEASDRTAPLDVARHAFAPEEVARLDAVPATHRVETFLRLWTLKEAFIKATGEGLARPLHAFSFTLDPVRIAFHPERDEERRQDDPDSWQFGEWRPAPNGMLAMAVRPGRTTRLRLDARAVAPDDVGAA